MTEVTLRVKDQQRLGVLSALDAGRQTAMEAAELLDLSVRQTWRLLARYRAQGPAGVVHGNRGRSPRHTLDAEIRQRVVDLVKELYHSDNNHQTQEILAEEHGIRISVSTLRRIRLAHGCPSPRQRRPPKPHPRRERKPQAGMMILIDASKHRWLGPDHPDCFLLAGIDDATGESFWLFREEEDTVGYMLLLDKILRARGVPLSLYSDRRTLFGPPIDGRTENLESQFARAVNELGISQIFARSPQAKGRVERLFGTLQDRLIPRLVRAGARSIDEANRMLPELQRQHNHRFVVEPASPDSAYRPAPSADARRRILALHYTRVVANDNTVSFGGKDLLIPTKPRRRLARTRVTVVVQPDGQIAFWSGDELIAPGPKTKPLTTIEPAHIVAQIERRPPRTQEPRHVASKRPEPVIVRPAPDHPWRQSHRRPQTSQHIQSGAPHGG